MAFVKKTWKDRISQYPNRRTINDGFVTKQVTIGRDEGTVTEEGTPFDATEMNDLENRIYAAIEQGGGGGGGAGTYDYTELFNKPRINNHELNGNKTLSDLGIASNADELPIESGSATNTKDYIDTKQDKYWKKLSSAFELTGNATGTWSFTDDLSTSKYTDIMFCISLVSNDGGVRSSMSLSRLGFEAYGVFYDYTIGSDRMYFQLSKSTNNSFTISGTNLGGISSRVFVTAYYR